MQGVENIRIVPLEQKHMGQVEKWPSRFAATNTLLKKPVETGGQAPGSYGWAAVDGDEVLAIVTVKLNQEHIGYINCIVKPGNKRKGIGTTIFDYALRQPEAKNLIHLHAAVDPDNIGARQVLSQHGFSFIGNDQNGYMEYALHKN